MTEPSKAVFVSYASQDAEAARLICGALVAAGIEVWFDQSELRGGDAWDQKIRREIRDCALFVPIISQNTQTRAEGYFRLEWRLADQRTHLMARGSAFVLPVCVDDTRDTDAEVPESFSAVQWLRLPGAHALSILVERVSLLLSDRGRAPPVPTSSLSESAPATIVPAQSSTPERSIAVLPFVDLSEKHDQEYFADGMAEEILNLLGKIRQLSVIGRTSSFQFKGKTGDLRKIGAVLGATYIVEGSVCQSAGNVRVTARLIDTRNGVQRWSERYDRNARDVLQLQNEIAASLVSALQVEVAADVLFPLQSARESSPAYHIYLRGLHAAYRFDQRGFEEAVADFRYALELDPSFVAPAELLAVVLDLLTEWQLVPPKLGFGQVRAAANIALQLDGQSAIAHAILANVHTFFDWDRSAAARESKTALAIAPQHPIVLILAAKERQVVGEWHDAMQLLNAALTVDPLQPAAYVTRGHVYQRLNRPLEAESDYRRALGISPTYGRVRTLLGEVLVAERKPEAALVEIQQELHGSNQLKGLAVAYHALDRRTESDAALARLETTGADTSAMQIAEVYAFRGQKDEAFQWLDRAVEQKDVGLSSIKGHSLLKHLEGDPRYNALLRKMNLSE